MPITRDIAIFICSRGREAYLARLVDDMERGAVPALAAGGMSACIYVYAQNYAPDWLDGLKACHRDAVAAGRLIVVASERPHASIGEVIAAAATALHRRVDYRLAMLMDDDSLYRPAPDIDANLRQAAQGFLASGARAYSIKLGRQRQLEFWPFIDPAGPIMPFKEKMLWLSRAVMEEALAFPRFADLSVGEDAVLSALAWRGGADRCRGVLGIATFLHLGFEPDEEAGAAHIPGGYGELMGYDAATAPPSDLGKYEKALLSGVTPWTVMPEIFVPPGHAQFYNNGILDAAVARHNGGAGFRRLDGGEPRS